MDIKCPVCRRKLGHVARPEAKGRFFCTACDLWVAFTKKRCQNFLSLATTWKINSSKLILKSTSIISIMKFGYEAYTYIYLTHSLLYPPFGGVLFYIGDDFMISTSIHRVNFYDTDAMAVVHHSNYIRWFEIGRVNFLREIGITLGEMMEDGYVFPITEVKCKYIASGKFDDVLRIETTPVALTKVKMEFSYKIYRDCDNTLLVEGFTQNVFTSKATGHITRLPEKYYTKMQNALK